MRSENERLSHGNMWPSIMTTLNAVPVPIPASPLFPLMPYMPTLTPLPNQTTNIHSIILLKTYQDT